MSLTADIERCLEAAFTPERVASNEIQQHEWELRTFLELVNSELNPKRTVELGTYKGWTAALLSLVTSDDTVTIDVQDWGTADSAPFGYHLTHLVTDACNPDVPAALIEKLGGPIDLLFIDDGHYYEQVTKEYEQWKHYVRPGGWIVFHDINPLANIGPHGVQPQSIQVPRFWKELQGEKQEIIATEEHAKWRGVIPHGGLGILRL